MIDLANLEVWFVAGSQHLYGPEALRNVEQHSTAIADALSASTQMPVKIVCKPVMTTTPFTSYAWTRMARRIAWA